jgi:hypothetical protein
VPVRERVAELLDRAPSAKSGLPQDFTHRELARLVYGTEEPTAAQESAVRRAVAALVADGLAERNTDRSAYCGWEQRSGSHERRSRDGEWTYVYANPSGVTVRRVMTAADREARAAVLDAHGLVDAAERIRRGAEA